MQNTQHLNNAQSIGIFHTGKVSSDPALAWLQNAQDLHSYTAVFVRIINFDTDTRLAQLNRLFNIRRVGCFDKLT